MSQPAREFIVKTVEMSLWASDFLLAHILLVILTVPVLIPFVNTLHSTMLCECFLFLFWGGWDIDFGLVKFGFALRNRSDHRSFRPNRSANGGGL